MNGGLRVQLSEEGADAERLDTLTSSLRHELLQLDVTNVTALRAGEPPAGTRGLDAATVGGLLVNLGSAATGLTAVISVIRTWLARYGGGRRSVRLEMGGDALELSDATAADQERLIRLFIDRHATEAEER